MALSDSSVQHPMLRKGVPGEKKPLKEKLISYYEQIFEVTKGVCMCMYIINYEGE